MTTSFDMIQRERKALAFIRSYREQYGKSPSFSELQDHLHLKSKASVSRVISALQAQGHISRSPNKRRGVTITSGVSLDWLIPPVRARLEAHCAKHGDDITAVLIDAVVLHLDSFEPATVGQSQARVQ